MQQGLTALVACVRGNAAIEHATESVSVAHARMKERGAGKRDRVTGRSRQRARFRHGVFLHAPAGVPDYSCRPVIPAPWLSPA